MDNKHNEKFHFSSVYVYGIFLQKFENFVASRQIMMMTRGFRRMYIVTIDFKKVVKLNKVVKLISL